MAEWVTFYWDVFDGVKNLIIHPNKEEATKYFKSNYKLYFELGGKTKVELPMSYGYAHRRFCGMSKRKFENEFGVIKRGGSE